MSSAAVSKFHPSTSMISFSIPARCSKYDAAPVSAVTNAKSCSADALASVADVRVDAS